MVSDAQEFLVEPDYAALLAEHEAARRLLQCVLPFADRYRAWQSDYADPAREGELPRGKALDVLLDDLLRWGSGQRVDIPTPPRRLGLLLYRGDTLVFTQTESGFPERLLLTPEQFEELQACL